MIYFSIKKEASLVITNGASQTLRRYCRVDIPLIVIEAKHDNCVIGLKFNPTNHVVVLVPAGSLENPGRAFLSFKHPPNRVSKLCSGIGVKRVYRFERRRPVQILHQNESQTVMLRIHHLILDETFPKT